MKQHDIITVNGQAYDTVTGLPVATAPEKKAATPTPPPKSTTSAHSLHATTQRSKTLRRTTPKPQQKATIPTTTTKQHMSADIQPRKRPGKQVADIARHPHVGRLVNPVSASAQKASTPPKHEDIAPRHHPHVAKAEQHLAQKKQQAQTKTISTPISSKEKKESEITKALTAKPAETPKVHHRKRRSSRSMRIGIISASVVIVAIIAIWINLPTLSVAFASAQAGVNADYPHYTPEGYTLQLPVNADNNRVTMSFSSNQNQTSFSFSQEKSAWDSQAVRAIVEEESKGQFLTTQDRGLTVYTYDGNAAWVNKGMLYKISGDSRLSNDTIMRIAGSL